MNKTDLRAIIREEVRQELYAVLPDLLREALTGVMQKASAPKRRTPVQESRQPRPTQKSFDRTKLARMIGYGDMKPGMSYMDEPASGRRIEEVREVAGVPVQGGLRAMEQAAGLAHLSNMSWDEGATRGVQGADEVDVVDSAGGPEVPMALVEALGTRAKAVLDEAERKANWRPGMKKRK